MIRIVIGSVESGKTSRVVSLYEKDHRGDGFVAERLMKDGKFVGYTLRRLSEQKKRPWMILRPLAKGDDRYDGIVGPFAVDLDTLTKAKREITIMIALRTSPIYLDEIGRWEMAQGGFASTLRQLVHSNVDLVISMRDDLLIEGTREFRMASYMVIDVRGG